MRSRTVTPGHHAFDCPARLGFVKALRFAPTPLRAASALTRPSREPGSGNYVMAGQSHGSFDVGLDSKGRNTMNVTSITPSIGVTIGRHSRLYYAYITTAPAALDAPSTMTLHTAPLVDVVGLACDEIVFDACRARTKARLILVDATERGWQKRRFREHGHIFAPADPMLVGLNTLQSWLWQRLGTAATEDCTQLAHA